MGAAISAGLRRRASPQVRQAAPARAPANLRPRLSSGVLWLAPGAAVLMGASGGSVWQAVECGRLQGGA